MQKLEFGGIVLIAIAIVMVSTAGAQTAFVAGQKFYDYNQNGVYDSYDFPLQDWTIRLYWLNGTAVPGKEATTGLDGTYNISDINPYFSYNITEDVQPGWNPTSPANSTVYFVTCGGGEFEFLTNVSNMIVFMPTTNDATSHVLFGYNARIGNAVQGGGGTENEGKIFYPQGQWNTAGQQSVGISPDIDFIWVSDTYYPFNATYYPGQNASWTVNGATVIQDTAFPPRPDAIPIRDIIIRLHSEDDRWTVTINNTTLEQGPYTYSLINSPLTMTSNAEQDKWLVLRASDIFIAEGGQDIAGGGFNLTGDIKLIWPDTGQKPKNNDIKMDIYVGRYDCYPVLGAVKNFGNYIAGNVSGYKRDESGNLLAGWNITLTNETRAFYAYNVTNASGYYSIGNVPFGEYWLNETISEWLSWIPVIGNRTVEINQTNLVLINQNFTNNQVNGSLSGYKFNETLVGQPGWTIQLYNETTGALVNTTVTGSGGYYVFENINDWGLYNITEVQQTGWALTDPAGGWHSDIFINGIPVATQYNFTNDRLNGSVSGYKFNETGAGLADWTIQLYNETTGALVNTTVTGSGGYYVFENINDWGLYNITEVQQTGWALTDPAGGWHSDIFIDGIPVATQYNFTNDRLNGSVSGYKFNETGAGQPGWTIQLYNETTGALVNTTVTGSGGYYVFENINDWGLYNITEVQQTGWNLLTPGSGWYSHIYVNGIPITDQYNFTNDRLNGSVSGYKFNETLVGQPGWTIELYNETSGVLVNTTTAGSGGYYVFENINDWGYYNITEVQQTGWNLLTPGSGWYSHIYVNGIPITDQYNFTNDRLNGSVSGYKFNETLVGQPGWMIELYNETSGVLVNTTTTGSGGYYVFENINDWGYYNITEVQQTGWNLLTPGSGWYSHIYVNGIPITDQYNFTNEQLFGYISGYKIQNETGLGVPNWIIEAYEQTGSTFVKSAMTDGSGFYNITGLPYGETYNVSEVVQPGWTPVSPVFIPDLTIDEQTPYRENINFTNDPPVAPMIGNITGKKGDQKCPDCGLPGWIITLYYASNGSVYATDTTGPEGTYEFLSVPYGTYWLNETLILGWKQITPNTTITLNATNPDAMYNFINAEDKTCCVCPPTASFSYVKNGQKVQFTDTSTGPHAVRWIWFFGDGTMSTVENPVKTYKVPGTYTVRLYITWADCDGVTYHWKSASQRIRVP